MNRMCQCVTNLLRLCYMSWLWRPWGSIVGINRCTSENIAEGLGCYGNENLLPEPCNQACRRRCRPSGRDRFVVCTCRNRQCARGLRSRAKCCPASNLCVVGHHIRIYFISRTFASYPLFIHDFTHIGIYS